MIKTTDVLIIGTGAAGLFCALNFPERVKVLIITKKKADESDSFLAQGGICMLRGEEDYENYFEDTMKAGHYENNGKTVDVMIRSSNSVIKELLRYGVRFERNDKGELEFTKEGAHSQPRILFHEDITGKEITSTLLEVAKTKPNITILEDTTMIDIIEKDNVVGGIVAIDSQGEKFIIKSNNVVLASGGIGGVYRNTTNFPHITGDALAICIKHGVEVENVDYVQIHPTTFFTNKRGRRFLISESVRGEGAYLLDKNGQRFTDELQPRDVVSQAIWDQMKKDNTYHVWEDLRPLGKDVILNHFPNIYQHCLDNGYDCLKEPIPVVPAQHYHMGGIKTDLAAKTSMEGLYAVGEAGCNGVHGKNRLASNSLLESIVFAERAAADILFATPNRGCNVDDVDLSVYNDIDGLFKEYRQVILDTIERMSKEHE